MPTGRPSLATDHAITSARAHGLAATSLRYFNCRAGAGGGLAKSGTVSRLTGSVVRRSRLVSAPRYWPTVTTADADGTFAGLHPRPGSRRRASAGPGTPGQYSIYNLGSGAGFSVREVIDCCCRVTGLIAHPRRRTAGGGSGGADRLQRVGHQRTRLESELTTTTRSSPMLGNSFGLSPRKHLRARPDVAGRTGPDVVDILRRRAGHLRGLGHHSEVAPRAGLPSQASITYSQASAGSVAVSEDSRSIRQRIFLCRPISEPSQRSMFCSSVGVTS